MYGINTSIVEKVLLVKKLQRLFSYYEWNFDILELIHNRMDSKIGNIKRKKLQDISYFLQGTLCVKQDCYYIRK